MIKTLIKYLKFGSCIFLVLTTIASFTAGGAWLWFTFAFTVLVSLAGDAWLPPDSDDLQYRHRWLLDLYLYLNLPLLLCAQFIFFWQCSDHDLWGLGSYLQHSWGLDVLVRKENTHGWHRLGGFLSLGLMFGIVGTNIAHELVHRTWNSLAVETGRWLLAFTWDSAFAVEHVYGHHRRVGTWDDPATARRGESYCAFLVRSTSGGHRSAWSLEKSRLKKRRRAFWSWHNRILRGWAYSVIYAAMASVLLGWKGLLLHALLAAYGKCFLELVNYIEHYGLVRLPASKVECHHSWNSNARFSSWSLFHLTRHSHHHQRGELPYWRLQALAEAPALPYGYMAMILVALIPPLYKKLMEPYLLFWDQHHATQAEAQLAVEQGHAQPFNVGAKSLASRQN